MNQLPVQRRRRRRWLKRISVLPTLMTLSNLLCGFIAIVLVLEAGKYLQAGTETVDDKFPQFMSYACWAIFVGMIFDLLDGHMARLTKTVSGFGKEIDSLADCVTFGVAPAVIVWQLGSANLQLVGDAGKLVALSGRVLWAILAVYVACAAMRLARYNVETNRAPPNTFFGLPSPAAAGAVAGLVLLHFHLAYYAQAEFQPWIGSGLTALLSLFGRGLGHAIPLLTLVIGVLMVTRIYYVHAGKKLLRGKRSFTHVVVLLLAAAMFFTYPEGALALLFCGYVLWGLAGEVRLRLKAPEEIRRRKALVRGASSIPADGGAADVRKKTP